MTAIGGGQPGYLGVGKTPGLGGLAKGGLGLKGIVGADHGYVLATPAIKDIVNDVVADTPAEIDV